VLNSQLRSLNISLLRNLRKTQCYITLEPLILEKKELEVGDFIFFEKLNFFAKNSKGIVGKLKLGKKEDKEGFLVTEVFEVPKKEEIILDKNFMILEFRVGAISKEMLKERNWIEFKWKISDGLICFLENKPVAVGVLGESEDGFCIKIIEENIFYE